MKKISVNRRGILVFAAVLLFLTAAVGGAIPLLSRGLPDPEKANREELLRWMVTRDLAKEPPVTQLALARRLESEFAAGVDWAAFKNKINDSQRRQLLNNITCVLRPWILEKAETYGRLAAEGRDAFLDQLLDTLDVWKGVEKLMPKQAQNGQGAAKPTDMNDLMMQEMAKLQKDSSPEQQKQIGQLCVAVQLRKVMRTFAPKT